MNAEIIIQKLNFVNLRAINQLSEYRQFVNWRYDKAGKKTPIDSKSGKYASVNKPDSWSDYQTALVSCERQNYAGIGFVFSESDSIVGIDLDDCILSDGSLTPFASEILASVESYCEVSPSGNGLKIFARCNQNFDAAIFKDADRKIEVYSHSRYFTITGDHSTDTPTDIRDCSTEILSLVDEIREWNGKAKKSSTSFNIKDKAVRQQDSRIIYVRSAERYAKKTLFNELEILNKTLPGNRVNQLVESSFNLGQLLYQQRLDRSFVENKLWQVAYKLSDLEPKLTHYEIKKAIENGLSAGLESPRRLVLEYDVKTLAFYEISPAIGLYSFMRKFVNRDNGYRLTESGTVKKVDVWANLDKYHEQGYLAFARHHSTLARLFLGDSKRRNAIWHWIQKLKSIGAIKQIGEEVQTMYDSAEKQIVIYSLGEHWIEKDEVHEQFYVNL